MTTRRRFDLGDVTIWVKISEGPERHAHAEAAVYGAKADRDHALLFMLATLTEKLEALDRRTAEMASRLAFAGRAATAAAAAAAARKPSAAEAELQRRRHAKNERNRRYRARKRAQQAAHGG